ncbi:putative lipoprotein YiaD [compost metagenome]
MVGYTDSTGSRQHNMDLSQRRAQSVVSYLTSQGVDASRVTARGLGPDQPIASNADANGRAQNRRVEVNLKPIPGQQYQ